MDDLRQEALARIVGQEGVELTDDQAIALSQFLDFFKADIPRAALVLTGSAGTGKTFLIHIISSYLRKSGYKTTLLAPTGRAAKVVTKRARRAAFTIHHHIYSTAEGSFGGLMFELKRNKEQTQTVYIVDEASMIGDGREEGSRNSLLGDLMRFVFGEDDRRKLILVGDPVQLPPVGSDKSPALDPDVLERKFNLTVWHAHLEEVKRQMEDSGILGNAVILRDALLNFDEGVRPVLVQKRDVLSLENGYEAIESYLGYYRDGEMDRVVMICYSNFKAAKINQAIRHQLLETDQPLAYGDLIMVVKNNYTWGEEKRLPFIANGEMGIIRGVYDDSKEEKYGLKWVDVDVEFEDSMGEAYQVNGKVVLDLLDSKLPQLPDEMLARVAEERRREYADLPMTQAAEMLRTDPYINALQIKYGYAITGHKSQGGQWKNVIVVFEPDYGNNPEAYLRWVYTVFTRAEDRVMLLDCPFLE